uniref:ANTAR domain-containing protein n=1 Tax=uncultured Nocardioidaceae bacterium TaxID=253824 RepID=A0A6J4MEN0_9ACTN|nr:MAG: hypothetical protein AVDCRST_MAG46-2926 [uncultured Nocardioidaceae bacterium]
MATSDADRAAQQAFHRLSGLRLRHESMHSALNEVVNLTKTTLPGASEVSVSLVAKDRADTVVSTGQLATDLDESQYQRGYGPCLDAARERQVMHIEDSATETRWGDYTKAAVEHGALSSVSVPLALEEAPMVTAALNIYSTQAHGFDDEGLAAAITWGHYAESMLANMYAYDRARELVKQLATALENRGVIDQSKGIIMRDRGCTAEEAFDLLVAASQRLNRKLRLVAQDVVNSTAKDS